MDNTIENNRLIAEFMGFDGQHEEWCGNNVLEEVFVGFDEMRPYNPHSNWSDLMPVAEKIVNDKSVRILIDLNGVKDSIAPYINSVRPIKQALMRIDFKGVYDGIIQFIKWYNSNQPPTINQ